MRRHRNMFQTKEQDKTPEELSGVEIISLRPKEFKVMIITTLNKLRRMNEHVRRLMKSAKI